MPKTSKIILTFLQNYHLIFNVSFKKFPKFKNTPLCIHDRPIPFPFPVTAVKLAKSRLLGSIPINCSRLKLPYPDTYTQITSAYLAPSRIREAVKKNKRALNAKGVERDEAREGKIKRERENIIIVP